MKNQSKARSDLGIPDQDGANSSKV